MDIHRWLHEFRELHEGARANTLNAEGRVRYLAARDRMAHALCVIQGLGGVTGRTARQSFRVAQAVQVSLVAPGHELRLVTVDVSAGGFSALLARPPGPQVLLETTLYLGQGRPVIRAQSRVVNVNLRNGASRVSFAFASLEGPDRERLEFALFDWALARLQSPTQRAAAG